MTSRRVQGMSSSPGSPHRCENTAGSGLQNTAGSYTPPSYGYHRHSGGSRLSTPRSYRGGSSAGKAVESGNEEGGELGPEAEGSGSTGGDFSSWCRIFTKLSDGTPRHFEMKCAKPDVETLKLLLVEMEQQQRDLSAATFSSIRGSKSGEKVNTAHPAQVLSPTSAAAPATSGGGEARISMENVEVRLLPTKHGSLHFDEEQSRKVSKSTSAAFQGNYYCATIIIKDTPRRSPHTHHPRAVATAAAAAAAVTPLQASPGRNSRRRESHSLVATELEEGASGGAPPESEGSQEEAKNNLPPATRWSTYFERSSRTSPHLA